MADSVRGIMEGMVPELEDYERRGYFSAAEVAAIARRRQQFEYSLRRRNTVLADFLRYYEHEWKLEQLRQARRKLRGISGKRSLADYGIVRRIHFIFERATRKFKGELGVWSAWLDFCKRSDSAKQVSKVVTKALKLHPAQPFLWAYAAAWELESNGNAAAARALMQTGLRNCPASGSLWLEYFRMELLYANRLAARRHALGLLDNPPATVKHPRTETLPGTKKRSRRNGDSDGNTVRSTDADGAAPASDAETQILQGRLAQLVHDEAVQKLPDSVELRSSMLRGIAEVPFTGQEQLSTALVERFAADFKHNAEGCCALAKCIEAGHAPSLGSGIGAAADFLVSCVQSAASPELQQAAVEHVASKAVQPDGNGSADDSTSEAAPAAWLQALDRVAACTVPGGPSARVVALRCEALARRGCFGAAQALLDTALGHQPSSAQLWQLALRLQCMSTSASHIASACAGGTDSAEAHSSGDVISHAQGSVTKMVSDAFAGVAATDAALLLAPAAAALDAVRASLQPVTNKAVQLLCNGHGSGRHAEAISKAAAAVYTATWHCGGAGEAAAIAAQLERGPSPGLRYWLQKLSLLYAHSTRHPHKDDVGGSRSPPRKGTACAPSDVHQDFEAAVRAHGRDSVELWLLWAQHERSHGKAVGKLTARAVAMLEDGLADGFVLRLQQGAQH